MRTLLLLLGLAAFSTGATGATETVLYRFCPLPPCDDGAAPVGSLVLDSSGNLYGTTISGGAYENGTVFELSPSDNGWTETVLYSFCALSQCQDGARPTSSLVFDSRGNLYGTASVGGAFHEGVVFELSPTNNGWTERVIHTFNDSGDGSQPIAGVVFDSTGNLYGTTLSGGAYRNGTVFELTYSNEQWTETILHSFCGPPNCADGAFPLAPVLIDSKGHLYGTTSEGGQYFNGGSVFELSKTKTGWTAAVLYSFSGGYDGGYPGAGVILDQSGDLYGTTYFGGAYACGTVFKVVPKSKSHQRLRSFKCSGPDGALPKSELLLKNGDLYGTTAVGGVDNGGTVFELTLAANGKWEETLLHDFQSDKRDGMTPIAGLVQDSNGNLYGTASGGGLNNGGTVYRMNP
jgi:uncharacterized repeat protein (TIGR03803 family)